MFCSNCGKEALDGDKFCRNCGASLEGKPIVVVEYQEFRKEVNEIVRRVPDGLGIGTFIWEATSPAWGDLFDERGRTTGYMKLYDAFWQEAGKR